MLYKKPTKVFKSKIRELNIEKISYPAACSLPFIKSENGNSSALFALEILMNIPKNYSNVLKNFWGDLIYDMKKWAIKAEKTNCDLLSLRFNILDETEIDKAVSIFKELLKIIKKPLIVTGSNKKNIDILLLPKLAKEAERQCIFGLAEQETYVPLAEVVAEKNHLIIARTPMDINLAKELNILLIEKNIKPENIIVDTNIGALGYGLDYGYSIIERVKLAGLDGDEMLNMPVIAFVGEEAWKAKESRVEEFEEKYYGNLMDRALAWESATAASIMLAGANILVLWHPDVISSLKEFVGEK